MGKKTLTDVQVTGKKVFCRVDFNVPLQNGKITDDIANSGRFAHH